MGLKASVPSWKAKVGAKLRSAHPRLHHYIHVPPFPESHSNAASLLFPGTMATDRQLPALRPVHLENACSMPASTDNASTIPASDGSFSYLRFNTPKVEDHQASLADPDNCGNVPTSEVHHLKSLWPCFFVALFRPACPRPHWQLQGGEYETGSAISTHQRAPLMSSYTTLRPIDVRGVLGGTHRFEA
ncbi:hypothetical protein BDQ17DRAFT_1411573 [Cyathus striatus]|nr:hypothetical protein BDQ17DRAFT_1411573 [Cyathus striatus]